MREDEKMVFPLEIFKLARSGNGRYPPTPGKLYSWEYLGPQPLSYTLTVQRPRKVSMGIVEYTYVPRKLNRSLIDALHPTGQTGPGRRTVSSSFLQPNMFCMRHRHWSIAEDYRCEDESREESRKTHRYITPHGPHLGLNSRIRVGYLILWRCLSTSEAVKIQTCRWPYPPVHLARGTPLLPGQGAADRQVYWAHYNLPSVVLQST